MRLTAAQQTAVTHRAGDMLVSASAGSGKTSVLAGRVLDLICDARTPTSVDRLLVVTFTRAAAAELRARIAAALRRAALSQDDLAQRERLLREELLLETAEIGTIDAWCGRLLREHYDVAGVDPSFSMLAPEAAEALRRRAMDELLEWVYSADEPSAEAARRWLRREARPSDEPLRQMLDGLSRFREQLIDPRGWLRRQRQAADGGADGARRAAEQSLTAALLADLRLQQRFVAEIGDPPTDVLRNWRDAYDAALSDWIAALSRGRPLVEVVRGISDYSFGTMPRGLDDSAKAYGVQLRDKALKRRLKTPWASDRILSILDDAGAAAEFVRTLLDLESAYHDRVREAKRRRGQLEFSDVLSGALDLLAVTDDDGERVASATAQALRERYEHILVDEFQDTSPVQAELIRLVSRPAGTGGNRFLVGDLKQSIYGFRRADPTLFARTAEDMSRDGAAGTLHPLRENFRTHRDLLAGLNAIFERLFSPELGGLKYDEAARLAAGREEPTSTADGVEPRLEVHVVSETASSGRDDEPDAEYDPEIEFLERMQREARVVAARLADLRDRPPWIPEVSPEGTRTLRRMNWSDAAVLLRAAARNVDQLAGELRALGIPCAAGRRESLLDSSEARDVRAVLSLLAQRDQDVPLATLLRGPLTELSPDDLLDIREASQAGSLLCAAQTYLAEPRDERIAAALRAALRRLDGWRACARREAVPELLRRIIRDSALSSFVAGQASGRQRVARLESLVELAVRFDASGGGGLSEFVQHLDQLAESEFTAAGAGVESDAAVRIMTIHAAKGLEFPVVFLVNCGARFRRDSRALECDPACGLGIRFYDRTTRRTIRSAAHELSVRARLTRERDEELRLFYVAATRAREHFVAVGHSARAAPRAVEEAGPLPLLARLGADSMLDWILAAAENTPAPISPGERIAISRHRLSDLSAARPVGPDPSVIEPRALSDEDTAWLEHAIRCIGLAPSASADTPAVISATVARNRLAASEADAPREPFRVSHDLDVPRFAQRSDAQAADGREFGSAMHRFLEVCDLARLGDEAEIARQVEDATASGRLTRRQAELLNRADLAWLGRSELGALFRSEHATARRELPLLWGVPESDAEEDRMLLRGVIDCVLERDDGLWILDYKTDRPASDAARLAATERYALQVQLYGAAAARLLDRSVARLALVWLSQRRLDWIAPDPQAPERLATLLRDSDPDRH